MRTTRWITLPLAALAMLPLASQAEIHFANETAAWAWVTVYEHDGWGKMNIKATGCVRPRHRQDVGDGNAPIFTFNTRREAIRVRAEMTNPDCQHPVHCDTAINPEQVNYRAPGGSQYSPGTMVFSLRANPQTCWIVVDSKLEFKLGAMDGPPPPPPPPPPGVTETDRMTAYQFLQGGGYLVSANRRFFAMQQRDGNFCVLRGSGPHDNRGVLWCNNGRGVPAAGSYYTIVTGDGNLCTYRGESPQGGVSRVVWCAHSGERPNVGAGSVVVAYDGNLCLFPTNNPAGQATWCSNAVER